MDTFDIFFLSFYLYYPSLSSHLSGFTLFSVKVNSSLSAACILIAHIVLALQSSFNLHSLTAFKVPNDITLKNINVLVFHNPDTDSVNYCRIFSEIPNVLSSDIVPCIISFSALLTIHSCVSEKSFHHVVTYSKVGQKISEKEGGTLPKQGCSTHH